MGMELNLTIEIAKDYLSPAQRIRVMTEDWVNRSAFCPNGSNISEESLCLWDEDPCRQV